MQQLGSAAVVLYKATKSLFAANFAKSNCVWWFRNLFGPFAFVANGSDRFIVETLVGTFEMIVIDEFLAKDVHVLVTEDYEIVQAFLLNRLDKWLHKGNGIWRSNRRSM